MTTHVSLALADLSSRTRSLLIAFTLTATGCALPQYQTQLVPIVDNPSVPKSQASAICGPEAQLASANAKANAQARVDARNSQVTGYNCNTSGTSSSNYYQANTNCTPQTAGQYGGFAGGFNQGMEVGSAGNAAGNAVLQSCLARLGWRPEKYCVQNCK